MRIQVMVIVSAVATVLSVTSAAHGAMGIAASAEEVHPLGVGSRVPDAHLTTMQGESTTLGKVLGGKPTLLIFFRGGWCPYCTRHLAALGTVHDRLRALGFSVVAISPDSVDGNQGAVTEHKLDYTLLSDSRMESITAFGLAFKLSPELLEKYKGYGINLQESPGIDDRILPVPAVYIIDAAGRVGFVHYDSDYRRRLDPDAVLAAARAVRAAEPQQAIRTETVQYRDGQTVLKGYLARPVESGARRPGIVVFPEWWGLNDYAKRRARQLAGLGYVALAADVYGDGLATEIAQEAGKLAGLYKGDRRLMRARCSAALATLSALPDVDASRLAAIGYCFGGTCALELARSGAELKGVVSFHGGLAADPGVASEPLQAAVLVCHGADDPHVSGTEVAAFQQEMRDAGADWQFVHYAGAAHAFTNPGAGGHAIPGVAYDPRADVRSWTHMKAFLEERLE